MKNLKSHPVVLDADVAIDYLECNKKIITIYIKRIHSIYIPLPNLHEISQIEEKEAKKLGIILFEPTLNQIKEASQRGGPLSFEDKLCFIVARDEKINCVTNDNNLRKKCTAENINIAWGFDLMLMLNHAGLLSKTEAQDTANKIKDNNPYIKKEIIPEFIKKLK